MIKALQFLEAAFFTAALIFGVLWYLDVAGRWEALSGVFALATVGVGLVKRYIKKGRSERFTSNAARIHHREKLRQKFEEQLYKCRLNNLRQDVIIRHVDRIDDYPYNDDNSLGVSSWFRAEFLDLYERGIVLCLRLGELKQCEDGYRFVDYTNDEAPDLETLLMANIPFESIETVNMDGDRYYNFPHIYCYFDFDGEPYESKWFAEKPDHVGHHDFKKIAEYDEVLANNPKEGPLYFN